jgi:hypothetical protein
MTALSFLPEMDNQVNGERLLSCNASNRAVTPIFASFKEAYDGDENTTVASIVVGRKLASLSGRSLLHMC